MADSAYEVPPDLMEMYALLQAKLAVDLLSKSLSAARAGWLGTAVFEPTC